MLPIFITLKDQALIARRINVAHIADYRVVDGKASGLSYKTLVRFVGGGDVGVTQTPEEIDALIEFAVEQHIRKTTGHADYEEIRSSVGQIQESLSALQSEVDRMRDDQGMRPLWPNH